MILGRIFPLKISMFLSLTILALALFAPDTAFAEKKNWNISDYKEHLSHIKTSPALVVAIDDAIDNLPSDAVEVWTEIDLHLWKLVILAKLNEGKEAAEVAAKIQNGYDRVSYRNDRHYGRTMYQIVESLAKTDEIGFSYGVIQSLRETVYEKPNTFLEFTIDRCLIEVYIETFDYQRALDVSLFILNHPDYRSLEELQTYKIATINEVAFLYNKLGNGKNALTYISQAEKSLEGAQLAPDKLLKAQARNAGNRARAYLHLGKTEEAGVLGYEVLNAGKQLNEKYMIALGYKLVGSSAFHQGRYEDAIQYLEAGLSLVEEHNIFIMKQPFYKEYTSSLEALGRYEEALIWQRKLTTLEMEIYDALTITREKLNDVEFEAFKSYQELEALRQENEAQRERYTNDKNIRKLLINLVVSLFVAAIFLIGLLTYMRKNQKILRQSEQNAQIANKAKTEFLATMSHEIRTPMNGVMGMAQILQSTNLTDQQKELVEIMTRSGENLLVIINDILDFSKIEANQLELNIEAHDLEQSLNDVISLLDHKAKDKFIPVKFNYDPKLPKTFMIDAHRVRQIFTNLLGNAIKFTHEGEINVDVIGKADPKLGKKRIKIKIKDSGIGIPKEKLNFIFDKFTQAESSTTRNFGGTGLGLAISKRLTEAMGGTLTVKSKLGEGSTFTVSLPLEIVPNAANESKPPVIELPRSLNDTKPEKLHAMPQAKPQKTTAASGRALQILVAEDDEINITVIKAMLKHPKINLTLAKNGKEAVRAYLQQAFDIILMDVSMPVMDGVSATQAIREAEALEGSRRTPIICLSAHVMDHQRQEFIDSGMDDCLPKPIHKKQLLAAITRWLKASKTNQKVKPQNRMAS